ncbi:MAG: DUF1232 domain-containing protein [Tissierella sp.]|nr:DUF1232 domain-containing protein [Tissierella sp.]
MKINFQEIIKNLNAKANTIYYDNDRLNNLIKNSKKKLENNKAFSELIGDVKVAMDIIKLYLKGEYTSFSKGNLILIIIGFLYLVNPMDLIPDFVIGGFIDDAAVFAYILKMIQHEIEEFKVWKAGQVDEENIIHDEDVVDEDIIDLDDYDLQ